jgi:hypothetical protein
MARNPGGDPSTLDYSTPTTPSRLNADRIATGTRSDPLTRT